MSKFKPSVSIRVSRFYIGEFDKFVKNDRLDKRFNTYAEVKKRMEELLELSTDNEVYVCRSRRGEWGEWFEYWSFVNGKPKIVKEGWN